MFARALANEFARDVRAGLMRAGQKTLSCQYLYDDIGSALFDAITYLPEYGLTRADSRIIQAHARKLVARLPSNVVVAELGSGTGSKTRPILEQLGRRQIVVYYPIDVSPVALDRCARELGPLGAVVPLESSYLEGLREVAGRRDSGQTLLVLFLGSTIGNFEHPADVKFLRQIREILAAGDALLLGTDLEKPIHQLLDAYDDPLGVTAAFNLNLLARINRELDADFHLEHFEHVARFNDDVGSVEMHIRSRQRQTVAIPGAALSVGFLEGETIWTESSHKYSLDEIFRIAANTGFHCDSQWIDEE